MRTTFNYLVISSLFLMAACAKQVQKKTVSPAEDRSENIADARQCTSKMTGVTTARLANFFSRPVRNLEGDVTFCLELFSKANDATGNLTGQFRLEYEDDAGIRYLQFEEENSYWGEYKITGDMQYVHIIFADDYGFVQIKGESHVDDTLTNAAVRYYNFPTYDQALTQAVQEAQQKCKDGTWTVAQCMGYNFPSTFWWNQTQIYTSYAQYLVALAKTTLADTTKSNALGTASFDLLEAYNE
jgi:hypothetical protein